MKQGIMLNEDISYQATCSQATETFEVVTTVRVAQKSGTIATKKLDESIRLSFDELIQAIARAYGIDKTVPNK